MYRRLEGSGHFLLGYTFMRRMERRLRQAFSGLAAPGLVLERVARFVFDDAQLILMLFDEQHRETERLKTHLEARLELMASDQALEWFRAFADKRAGRITSELKIGVNPTPAWMLGLTEDEVQAASRILAEGQANLMNLPGVSEYDGLVAVSSTIRQCFMTAA